MLHRLTQLAQAIRQSLKHALGRRGAAEPGARADADPIPKTAPAPLPWRRAARPLLLGSGVLALGWALWAHPPLQRVARGEVLVRSNALTGGVSQFQDGAVLVIPALHEARQFPLRDQFYRPAQMSRATGAAPLQSVEGLSLGLDLTVRYAIDPTRLAQTTRSLPDDPAADVVAPALQGVVYRVIARHSVREIFSSQRAEIQKAIEDELRTRLATDGLLLRSVQIGQVDLPADYRRGLDGLLAEGLATEKMRYTLELKDKRVKETELDAMADKVRRETAAEAAGREQIIAAKAQEEAMKHVLPFKQRQIEQRQLEAEAERVARVKAADGNAQARRIEAQGEADARQKLADAEAYRVTRVGKSSADQMALEGALITRHPLLIQKTLADKLSDKIQVIIAPPPADGGFIGATLLGQARRAADDGAAAANAASANTPQEQ
jgi:regulator of protease activity HflC (stomatin/prohibitin superfamily)